MNKDELIKQINETLSQEFEIPLEKLTPKAHIIDDLELDSLDAVDMLVHLEDKTGITIDVEKMQEAKTLDDIYNLISENK